MFLAAEPDDGPAGTEGDGPWIAVTVPPLGSGDDERRLLDALAGQLATTASVTGARLVLVPHVGSLDGGLVDDVRCHDELARRLQRLGAPVTAKRLAHPAQVAALTRSADMVISARYHPLVFGLGGGVPCLGVFLDEQTRTKIRGALAFAGLQEWSLRAEAASVMLAAAATELWERRTAVRAHLDGLRPGWRSAASDHHAAVLAALGGAPVRCGPPPPPGPAPTPSGEWRTSASLVGALITRAETERRGLEDYALSLRASLGEAERYARSLRETLDLAQADREDLADRLADLEAPRRRRIRRSAAAVTRVTEPGHAHLRFSDLRHEQAGRDAVASMLVAYGTEAAARLELRRHQATLAEIDATATPFAPLAAALAAARGVDAHIDGPVDETARAGAQAGAALLARWFGFRAPRVVASQAAPAAAPRPGVALFFSRGLDSMASYALQRDRLDALISIDWVDPPYATPGTAGVWRGTQDAADDAGLPLLRVSTNVRRFTDPHLPWDFAHGATFCALGLLLSPSIGEAILSGAFPSGRAAPSGSHPDLDRLWSSSAVRIVTEEGGGGRNEKAALVAGVPFCTRWLKVCWERDGEGNCGRCCKCLLTMTNFQIAGRLDAVRERFEAELTPEAVLGVAIAGTPTTPANARLVLERLEPADPLHAAWQRMLEVALERDAATAREQQATGGGLHA